MPPQKPIDRFKALSAVLEREAQDEIAWSALKNVIELLTSVMKSAAIAGATTDSSNAPVIGVLKEFLDADEDTLLDMVKDDKRGLKRKIEILASNLDTLTEKIITRFARKEIDEQQAGIALECIRARVTIAGTPSTQKTQEIYQKAKTSGLKNIAGAYGYYAELTAYKFTDLLQNSTMHLT